MGKNRNKQWDVLVIGGGAAGMMAAVTAAREQKSVCILEKSEKLGKKLFATGNGKCNFTNAKMDASAFHGEKAFIEQVLQNFSLQDCLAFFHSIGIYPKNKNGYYYPNSEQAASVVYAFEQELKRLGVTISLENKVLDIRSGKNGICVTTEKGVFFGKKLVIAVGLLAAKQLGSDGSLLDVIKKMGHHFSPILPALCAFSCKGIPFAKAAGVRVQGSVTAVIDGAAAAEDSGEIQFTDYGLSGIPVFQISAYLSKALYAKKKVQILLRLLPDFEKELLLQELKQRTSAFSQSTAVCLLNGLLPQKLADILLEQAGINKNSFLYALEDEKLLRLAETIQNLPLCVTAYRDFAFAQVCTGGLRLSEIKRDTLESKFAAGVYFAGELLDVDGICGGYNLHFAWASGFLAGRDNRHRKEKQ